MIRHGAAHALDDFGVESDRVFASKKRSDNLDSQTQQREFKTEL